MCIPYQCFSLNGCSGIRFKMQYIETLHELLGDLEAAKGNRPDAGTLEAYRSHVQRLSSTLHPVAAPAFCRAAAASGRLTAVPALVGDAPQALLQPRPADWAQLPPPPPATASSPSHAAAAAGAQEASTSKPAGLGFQVSRGARENLAAQRQVRGTMVVYLPHV